MIETGDGGDYVRIGATTIDLERVDGLQNMAYLALFGGNVETNTKEFAPTEQRFDYWANSLLFANNTAIQFNSDTERLLNNVALTTESRLLIQQSVERDLAFMKAFSTVTVEVAITATDRVEILMRFQEPSNLETNEFVYIWDATERELTTN